MFKVNNKTKKQYFYNRKKKLHGHIFHTHITSVNRYMFKQASIPKHIQREYYYFYTKWPRPSFSFSFSYLHQVHTHTHLVYYCWFAFVMIHWLKLTLKFKIFVMFVVVKNWNMVMDSWWIATRYKRRAKKPNTTKYVKRL